MAFLKKADVSSSSWFAETLISHCPDNKLANFDAASSRFENVGSDGVKFFFSPTRSVQTQQWPPSLVSDQDLCRLSP